MGRLPDEHNQLDTLYSKFQVREFINSLVTLNYISGEDQGEDLQHLNLPH